MRLQARIPGATSVLVNDDRGAIGGRMRHFLIGRTLGEYLESRRDNILYLRMIAATAVVFGHAGLSGLSQEQYDFVHALFPATFVHVLGLIMFFLISGFLVTSSFARRGDFRRFVWARFLRLWPALVVCAIGVAFVIGPLATHWPIRDYLSSSRSTGPYDYVWGSVTLFDVRTSITGLFGRQPNRIHDLANGPLWTIPVEATMYLWVAVAGLLRLYRFPWVTSFVIAAVFSTLILWPMMTGPFATLNSKLSVQGFFGAGAIAYLLRDHIPISTGLMILIGAACYMARDTIHTTPFIWLAIAYFVFWFSYVPRIPAMPRGLDLSYGTYLWGWPIQQTLAHFWHFEHLLVYFAVTMLVVLPIAAASWVLIEKPALRWKDWSPRAQTPARKSRSPSIAAAAPNLASP